MSLALLLGAGFGRHALGQSAGDFVIGIVLDSESGRPIPELVMGIRELDLLAVTDAEGRFQVTGVPEGEWTLEFSHIAYGEQTQSIVIGEGSDQLFEIRIARQAIAVPPVIVRVQSDRAQRRASSGHSTGEVSRRVIDEASRRGLGLAALLRQEMASLRISSGGIGTCVEYRGSTAGGECLEIAVVMDGLFIADPSLFYASIPLNTIEHLELLSPGESGLLYGTRAGSGVLLVETRRGPRRLASDDDARLISGLDWSAESEPYPWIKVLAASVVANAAGLALGKVVAERCLTVSGSLSWGLRTRCNGAATVGSSLLSIAAPTLAGTYASRWAGATTRSTGRVSTTSIIGAIVVVSGYMLWVHGSAQDDATATAMGAGMLTVAAPVAMTLSDRMLRELRR